MSYVILKSDGSTLTTVNDGFLDSSTSLNLPGPSYVGYGRYLNENLVYLLENFASNSAPSGTNLQGQLWFDKYNQILKVFTASGYQPVNGVTNSGTQPVNPKNGDIWFNTSTYQTSLFNSGTWDLIGPQYTRNQGISGAIPIAVEDGSTSGVTHNILQFQYGNTVIATLSTDSTFIPLNYDAGFTRINPGITFNANIVGPTINSNLVGNVTGNLSGNVVGNVVGNLTGNVVATTVSGNLTGNVVATTVSGNLTGNVTSTNGQITNFSTGNAQITGGSITALTNFTATTAQATNFSSSNILVTGGTLNATTLNSTTAEATNFSTGNAQITGGSATGLTNFSSTNASVTNSTSTTAEATNFSTGNAQITGGSITGLTNFNTITAQATNFSSSNVLVTGGAITASTGTFGIVTASNVTVTNAIVSSGNVSNVTGINNLFTGANLQSSVATTKSASDSSTAIATTAFVHSILPQGTIIMWAGLSTPTGWQLCDGSNGTPDLRDRFIVGAGSTYSLGATGGANAVTIDANTMPSHVHAYTVSGSTATGGAHTHTVSDPGHYHGTTWYNINDFNQGSLSPGAEQYPDDQQGSFTINTDSKTTGISLANSIVHSHTINITGNTVATGGTQPHENRPPYYAVYYLQKMY